MQPNTPFNLLRLLQIVEERQFISSKNSNASINVIREIGYAVNMNKPILPLMLDDAPYAKASVSIS